MSENFRQKRRDYYALRSGLWYGEICIKAEAGDEAAIRHRKFIDLQVDHDYTLQTYIEASVEAAKSFHQVTELPKEIFAEARKAGVELFKIYWYGKDGDVAELREKKALEIYRKHFSELCCKERQAIIALVEGLL